MNMFSKSGNSYSGPLLSAMQTFGSGVEEGLTSLQNAVKSYSTSQVQDTVDAFEEQFCEEAKFEAAEKKPLNFTGKPSNHPEEDKHDLKARSAVDMNCSC